MAFATWVPNRAAASGATGVRGVSLVTDRPLPSICCAACKPGSAGGGVGRVRLISSRGGRLGLGRCWGVGFAAGHQRPGGAHGLVGQRHHARLGREQRAEARRGASVRPGRVLPAAGAGVPDGCGRPHHPHAAPRPVAGAGDPPQPGSARRRVVPKACGSGIFITSSEAATRPTPGTAASRASACCRPAWQAGSARRPAPTHHRSGRSGSAACCGRSDRGSHSSTSATSSMPNRQRVNHNLHQTLKVFPDRH